MEEYQKQHEEIKLAAKIAFDASVIAKSVAEKAVEAAQKVHDKMEYKFDAVHEKLDNIVERVTKQNGSVARSIEDINKLKGDKKYMFGAAAACLILIPVVYALIIDRVGKVEVTSQDSVSKQDLQNFKEDVKGLLQTYTSQISKIR